MSSLSTGQNGHSGQSEKAQLSPKSQIIQTWLDAHPQEALDLGVREIAERIQQDTGVKVSKSKVSEIRKQTE